MFFLFLFLVTIMLLQAWVYSGFSVTWNTSRFHGRCSDLDFSATAKRDTWVRKLHFWDRSCFDQSFHLQPITSGLVFDAHSFLSLYIN